MRAPSLDPACAGVVLALVAAARVREPEAPLAWLCGYAARASGESLGPMADPRREPETNGVPVARVVLSRREG